jgi:hypothetical protein
VYCLEDVDAPSPLARIQLPTDAAASATTSHDPELLGGVTTVDVPARVLDAGDRGDLYQSTDELAADGATVTAVPYYAWGHRDGDEMRVWLPTSVDPRD